ncbi:MAG: HEAT repeat domain-containing protein [Pseudomonadales bacterium]|nr:HEAT repeat domain-containing protein [Pseudomonadales bacterium]
MTMSNHTEELELRVIQYLYGDLSEREMEAFEDEMSRNAELRRLVEAEQRFNSSFPVGAQPLIDEERVQGNRWLLRQNLQRETRPRFSLGKWLQGLTEKPMTVAFQGAAMAMTFVLGIFVATPATQPADLTSTPSVAVADLSPLSLVNEDDYEIYQMKVNSYDAMTGDIDLSFSLASETRLTGNVSDRSVNQLMAVALQNDIDSASRLDTINALQPVVSGNQVYEALIYVLTNDQNPGVRYQAVQSLVALADEDRVRDALRYALQEDVNQGVRVEAFNALSAYRDEETLAVFREKVDADSNEYIRTQSRLILEELDQPAQSDQIL